MSSSILLRHARRRILATATGCPKPKPIASLNNLPARALSTNAACALISNANGHEKGKPSTWMKALAGITAAGTVVAGILDEKKAECCGIVGVIGTTDHDAR
jgi:hypothetical protein